MAMHFTSNPVEHGQAHWKLRTYLWLNMEQEYIEGLQEDLSSLGGF